MFSRLGVRSFQAVRIASIRGMATATRQHSSSVNKAALVAGFGSALAFSVTQAKSEGIFDTILSYVGMGGSTPSVWKSVEEDLKNLIDDDANLGPFMIRLAWHCSGSYEKESNTGGSNGATMRFKPESDHGGNAGLGIMRDILEDTKAKFPEITYADLYTFAGKVAVEHMGGPTIDWQPGRVDVSEGEGVTPDGRLPDGDKGANHLRDIFYAYGFDDNAIVALSGAHCLGFCHDDRSGFVGPWTDTPYSFNNKYFTYMKDKKWQLKQWDGPAQFEDAETQTLMMLPSDMALLTDTGFRKYVDIYAADEATFRKDFAKFFAELLELGVKR